MNHKCFIEIQARRQANANGYSSGHCVTSSNGKRAMKKGRKQDPSYFQVHIDVDALILSISGFLFAHFIL